MKSRKPILPADDLIAEDLHPRMLCLDCGQVVPTAADGRPLPHRMIEKRPDTIVRNWCPGGQRTKGEET